MKLLLTLTTDAGQFITQVECSFAEPELNLSATEFSFKHLLINKALEQLQADGKLDAAIRRYGGIQLQRSTQNAC
jgi:hypothetical protein